MRLNLSQEDQDLIKQAARDLKLKDGTGINASPKDYNPDDHAGKLTTDYSLNYVSGRGKRQHIAYNNSHPMEWETEFDRKRRLKEESENE